MRPEILTHSGAYFSFEEPHTSSIYLTDVAIALSRICRFTGHTTEFYSVAQHSVLVSNLVPKAIALEALLHDAAEAYLGDVSSPLKQLLPDYKIIEERVEAVIALAFALPPVRDPRIKHADMTALATERRDLMPHPPNDTGWSCLTLYPALPGRIYPQSPDDACASFIARYRALVR